MAPESKTSEDKKSSICRVCLNYDYEKELLGKGLSLFEKYNDILISEQINELTNISIIEGDGFPDRICPTCHLQLQSAYKFKKTCENTNELLQLAANSVKEKYATPIENLPVKFECPDDYEDYVDDSFQNDLQDNSIDEKQNVAPPDDSIDEKQKVAPPDDSIDENLNVEPPDDSIDDDEYLNVELSSRPSRAIDLKLECHDCGGFFQSKCKLRVHWKKVHLPQLDIKCSRCFLKFKTFAALKSHIKKNVMSCITAGEFLIEGEGKNLIYHCKECNFKTKHKYNLRAHEGLHSQNKRFKCHLCPISYATKCNLDRHLENLHKLYSSEGTCQICGKFIKGKEKMKSHLQRHRNNKGNFVCNICNAILKSNQNLNVHMLRHSDTKSYICEVCSYSFYTSSELSAHRSRSHIKSKFYKCDKCNFKSRWHGSVSKHRRKHTDTNVSCSICGTFLDNDLQMTLHLKKHTDKHHKCPHCDKSFFTRSVLCNHVKKIHKISILDS